MPRSGKQMKRSGRRHQAGGGRGETRQTRAASGSARRGLGHSRVRYDSSAYGSGSGSYVHATSRAAKASKRRSVPVALSLFLVVAFVAAMVFLVPNAVRIVSGGVGSLGFFGVSEPQQYESPYDWTQLAWEGGNADRAVLYKDGAPISDVGVDVSEFNGSIDWNAVAADGVSFAFVRVGARGYTEGGLSPDARYAQNLDGAAAAGLQVGAYFFSQAVSVEEAQAEADYVVQLLEGRPLSLPVVFDHEHVAETGARANHMTGDDLTACAEAFCQRIEAAGYQTMVYGNAWDMQRFGYGMDGSGGFELLSGRPVWLAEYDSAPSAAFHFEYWQYSNAGSVAGIPTQVDMNLRLLA